MVDVGVLLRGLRNGRVAAPLRRYLVLPWSWEALRVIGLNLCESLSLFLGELVPDSRISRMLLSGEIIAVNAKHVIGLHGDPDHVLHRYAV